MKGREIRTSSNAPAYAEQKKNLGLVELIAIGVGGMIGGGIFSILGLAVEISGHAAPFSFLIGTVIALMAGYSYVRLALTYHSDGASFTYLEKAFPNMLTIAGIAGWTVVIGYIGTLSLYAFTFGAYSSHLFGLNHLPHVRMLFSCGILLLFLGINLLGSSTMGKVEDIAVYIKISMLALLAAVGFYTVDSSRLRPLFDHGASSVFLGGALIFVAFEGFQLITNAVCETRDPARNIPRGLYGSIGITSVIYFIIALVAVGNLDVSAIHAAKEYALAAVAKPILGTFGVVLVDVAAMLATASAINATIFGASHLTYEISHDNLAPKAFSFRTKSGVPA
ncbi:MAG: amino acid permease, partial [Deltaproteobacteria bacterium]|nr:amino acid permease [Deltaproteobacteria bacterium]